MARSCALDTVPLRDTLASKHSFFEFPLLDDAPMGPASCPPASDGWWAPSPSHTGHHGTNTVDAIGATPDWLMPGWSAVHEPCAGGSHFSFLLEAAAAAATADDAYVMPAPPGLASDYDPMLAAVDTWCQAPLQPHVDCLRTPSGGKVVLDLAQQLGIQRTPPRKKVGPGPSFSGPCTPPATHSVAATTPSSVLKNVGDVMSPVKARRRRGSKDAKSPDRGSDQFWLPTATFVDLGGLTRVAARCNDH